MTHESPQIRMVDKDWVFSEAAGRECSIRDLTKIIAPGCGSGLLTKS
jgi:hypothetical protein